MVHLGDLASLFDVRKTIKVEKPSPWVIRWKITMGNQQAAAGGPGPLAPAAERSMYQSQYDAYIGRAKSVFERRLVAERIPTAKMKDFEYLGVLAEVDFGRVYVAKHSKYVGEAALKVLKKKRIRKEQKILHVLREKENTWALQNRFITALLCAFQDSKLVCMVFERAIYGDLSKLPKITLSNEATLKHIVAQIVLAFEYMHACSVIHRDLKSDNVLIYADFYVKLADFGRSKRIQDRTNTFEGYWPHYPPEFHKNVEYGKDVDFWHLGTLIFELFHGMKPHYDHRWTDEVVINHVLHESPRFPYYANRDSPINRLIAGLLAKERTERLGTRRAGIDDVKKHDWFSDIEFMKVFNKIERRRLPATPVSAEPMGPFFKSKKFNEGTTMTDYEDFDAFGP